MESNIPGVSFRRLLTHEDDRGTLTELFRNDWLDEPQYPVMVYLSMTKPGHVRGPHEHREQDDLFVFLGTSEFTLHLWENREGLKAAPETHTMPKGEAWLVIVPHGVVHGYRNSGAEEGWVFNGPNRLYGGVGVSGPVDEIRYETREDVPFRID